MKIIGWERKGNVVRFALGKDALDYWSGDDWNDTPYEYNAVTTPLFGTEYYADVAFRYRVSVLEPQDDWHIMEIVHFVWMISKNEKHLYWLLMLQVKSDFILNALIKKISLVYLWVINLKTLIGSRWVEL